MAFRSKATKRTKDYRDKNPVIKRSDLLEVIHDTKHEIQNS